MNLISLNANKRLASQAMRQRIATWAVSSQADVLLTQEPFTSNTSAPDAIGPYLHVGGNSKVAYWNHERWRASAPTLYTDYCMQIDMGYIRVLQVYLDAYRQTTRATQLEYLLSVVRSDQLRPTIIVGDFNLAPRPRDGLFGGYPSEFNSDIDRLPFYKLLEQGDLVDLGGEGEGVDYTIERLRQGNAMQFRCDLVLASKHVLAEIHWRYDHSVREPGGLTDHSAILIDLPVSLQIEDSPIQPSLFPMHEHDPAGARTGPEDYRPDRTAMARRGESAPARVLVKELRAGSDVRSILDYGCGRGADVTFYRSCGFDSVGYDPYGGFGFSVAPQRLFDVVTLVFVLNVLPDPWERAKVLMEAMRHVRPGGMMFVATRTRAEIERQALQNTWRVHNDGYWSHEGRRTFQRGFDAEEILRLARQAGLVPHPLSDRLPVNAGATMVVLQRGEDMH
jgi:SAM-dependent methyltransferase/exonuclease III